MASPDTVIWLQERTTLGILSDEVLGAIASEITETIVPPDTPIVTEGSLPEALYIIKSGRIEATSANPKNPALCCGLLPGTAINLKELLLNEATPSTIKTLTECHLWVVSAKKFRQITNQYPEIAQFVSRLLAAEIAQLASAFTYEQERSLELRPYLVTKAQRGIVGSSRYAMKLREQIRAAANTRKSVLIFGEPGLEKDNIAALIHYGSTSRRQPIIKVNCGILQTSGADLFGRVGGKPGLLEYVGNGTLILNNIQELPQELLPGIIHLLQTNTFTPIHRSEQEIPASRISHARIIIISEKAISLVERNVEHAIKVPPLRVRKADIQAQIEYYISLSARYRRLQKPQLTPEALRRLQSYDFPGNLQELKSLVERAIVQAENAKELTEEIFWAAETKKKRFRVNLLNLYPGLRRFLRSDWYPDRINYGVTTVAFAFIVAVLFIGPQTRDKNFVLNIFWDWWWAGFLFLFPFLGRIWCAFCPFMIYGEITQKLSLKLFPRQLKKWQREKAEKWGGWFLFGLFSLIFLWEELWNLENTAYLSGCLLLLITAGAVIFSAIFERRFWCRYLCPIGGMNGLFAKLSMTELRAQQGICSATCTTYQCYKGGVAKGEGLETNGCPLYSHPAQLEDNRDCVLCMTCLKACPHRSVEFNLRPPGIELWTTHIPQSYEVALLFLLLGGVFLHRLPEIQIWLGLNFGLNFDLSNFWQHLELSLLALLVPVTIPFIAYGLMLGFCWLQNQVKHKNRMVRQQGRQIQIKPKKFVELAYGYLPLVLGGNLAHYLRLALGEGGRILPVTFATFGLNGGSLPVLVAHPAVISFLQAMTLIFAILFAVILTQKITRQSVRNLWLQHVTIIILGISMWVIIV
ncbi:sigma 54-interacting transcriptional regulator [Calothrix sp. UHCC 0171]|uniref:sigma 54-interacting transcriptional regulator n=1 Tax=Calothrix sp. UHCC 0171 TaxID=3110245 RepID=UPI002B21890C|nr:sigma 54-interacting transcriptional regulator [Calothrix sp. UHCC 0171]MEA5570766.1 sigma 54-interacting transcriptional regulator [Calothrix sp. UHCC 0171]